MLRLFQPHEPPRTPDHTKLLSQTTAIIKTFQRPKDLDRLICSIRRYIPKLQILVGDDGFQPSPRSDVGYIRLPEDIGLSAGRNALLERVQTPYFLLLDDDWEFFRNTKIEKLTQLVAQGDLDIAAGNHVRIKRKALFIYRRRLQPYHGLFDFRDNQLRLVRGGHDQGNGYLLCDITHNFFVARTDTIRALGGWDPELHINEHEEFFVRAQRQGLRVGYRSDVMILHWTSRPEGYSKFRNRSYHQIAAKKIGVEAVIGYHGKAYIIDGPEATIMGQKPPAELKRAA
jgi:glycosyltransferase involved in cell wall biosynthesis